ncbi:MAG: hypothetical protein ABII01_02450 [Candidatus Woesearchaeota archaeon]
MKGRPIKSQIRQNIIEILHHMKRAYGYDLYRIYVEIFPKVTLRSIYYNLKKGVDLEEIRIDKIEREKGNYSWGEEAEKKYYAIGKKADVKDDKRVSDYFYKIKKKS